MSIKNVIWDLSGTLFKPQAKNMTPQELADYSFMLLMWSGKKEASPLDKVCFHVLEQLGEQTSPKDQIIRLHTGKPLPGILCSYLAGTIHSSEALEKILGFFTTWAPKNLSKEKQDLVQRMLETFFNPQALATRMRPIETAVNLMHQTANKSPLYILSNWDNDSFIPFYAKYGHTTLEPIDKKHIVISANTGYVKPQTGIYKYLLDTYNLKPTECLFIDDQEENINAAQELGIAGWQFQEHRAQDLEEYLKQLYLI